MNYRVLVTPRSFGKTDPSVFDTLEKAGIEIVRNPSGGILSKEMMIELIADCDGVILGVDPMDGDVIAAAPKLKAIAKYGVGVDNIDLPAAAARGISVSKTVGANSEAVADFAMALMLGLCRKVLPIDKKCRSGDWSKVTTPDISHKTLGLLGLGAIGKNVAKRAKGFDMKIIAHDVFWDEAYARDNGIIKATPEEIYAQSDFISLHLPLLPETKKIIGKEQIAMFKPNSILINTARGGLVDEEALYEALSEGRIFGAGLDAFEHEPPENEGWFELDNVIMGSHCAASTVGATEMMGRIAVSNLLRDLGI